MTSRYRWWFKTIHRYRLASAFLSSADLLQFLYNNNVQWCADTPNSSARTIWSTSAQWPEKHNLEVFQKCTLHTYIQMLRSRLCNTQITFFKLVFLANPARRYHRALCYWLTHTSLNVHSFSMWIICSGHMCASLTLWNTSLKRPSIVTSLTSFKNDLRPLRTVYHSELKSLDKLAAWSVKERVFLSTSELMVNIQLFWNITVDLDNGVEWSNSNWSTVPVHRLRDSAFVVA